MLFATCDRGCSFFFTLTSFQVIELLYLRAICHHALGAIREAVRDYEDCLNHVPKYERGSKGLARGIAG